MKKQDILRSFLNLDTLHLDNPKYVSKYCDAPISIRKGVPFGVYKLTKLFKTSKNGVRFKLVGLHEVEGPFTLINVVFGEGDVLTYPYGKDKDVKNIASTFINTFGSARRIKLYKELLTFTKNVDVQFPINVQDMQDLRVEYLEYVGLYKRDLFSLLVGESGGRTYRLPMDHVTVMCKKGENNYV